MQSEKQILVDPISMSSVDVIKPVPVTTKLLADGAGMISGEFSNFNRPYCSAVSKQQKRKDDQSDAAASAYARQHSVALGNLELLRERRSRRTKSCGEERASHSTPVNDVDPKISDQTKPENSTTWKNSESTRELEDKFTCGALCLFLPGFNKNAKPVKPRTDPVIDQGGIESHRVSLEKFDCGSWRSSAILDQHGETASSSNMFFDLPMELIRCSDVNDAEFPVTAAFVFDKINANESQIKGVLNTSIASSYSSSSSV